LVDTSTAVDAFLRFYYLDLLTLSFNFKNQYRTDINTNTTSCTQIDMCANHSIGSRKHAASPSFHHIGFSLVHAKPGFDGYEYRDFKFQDINGVYQYPHNDHWIEDEYQSWRRIETRFTGTSMTTGELTDVSDGDDYTIDLRKTYPGDSGYLDRFRPLFSHSWRTQIIYTDDIYVRKYVSNEPVHGSWGSEEVLYQ